MNATNETFEIYYDNHGHSGPYAGLEYACERAKALLSNCHSMTAIEVRPRSTKHLGGYEPKHKESVYYVKYDGVIYLQTYTGKVIAENNSKIMRFMC